ncbi:MAG: 2-oxoacid:acceptor oxidoreductase family protein [Nitrospinae bacterium]|nr:2-oxoacid:acceptor oxidoreductase family protein [Nitrospinota bacterium]
MIEIRIHGRGGQGAFTASNLLASALFKEGRYAQAFPSFNAERRGVPTAAFVRIDDSIIRLRCEVYTPDHIIVLDPTLFTMVDVTHGLKENGWIIINSDKRPNDFSSLSKRFKVATVDANSIAIKYHLGSHTAPIVNTAILGAFSRITGIVGIDAVLEVVEESIPTKRGENVAAAKETYEKVSIAEG